MSFSIKIVNNEDGKVLLESTNAQAIIGGVGVEGGEHIIGYTKCNAIKLAGTVHAAQKATTMLLKNNPEIEPLLEIGKLLESMEDLTKSKE